MDFNTKITLPTQNLIPGAAIFISLGYPLNDVTKFPITALIQTRALRPENAPSPFPNNLNFLDYNYYFNCKWYIGTLLFKILSLLVESPFFYYILQFFQVCDLFGRSRINFLQRWGWTTVLQGVKENYFHWYAKVIKRNSFSFNVSKFRLLMSFIL